jgi:hypothetical protein
MTRKPSATDAPKVSLEGWQKREGEMAAFALRQVLNEQTGSQRKAYSSEWERHETLAQILMSSSPIARKLVESIGAIKARDVHSGKSLRGRITDPALDYQMDIMNGMPADRLSFRGAPFDLVWSDLQPFAAAPAHFANINGDMDIGVGVTETYMDNPVAYGG